MTLRLGEGMGDYSFFVPFGAYEKSRALDAECFDPPQEEASASMITNAEDEQEETGR